MRRNLTRALGLALLGLALAVSPTLAETVVLKAKTLHPGNGKAIENGVVVVTNGKIQAVGSNLPVPEGAKVYTAENGAITAGLIDAASTAGQDPARWTEGAREVVPRTRVADALDLTGPALAALRKDGVTTVYVSASTGSVIGAQGAIVKTGGADGGGRVVDATHSVAGTISSDAYSRYNFNFPPFASPAVYSRRPTTRMGLIWAWRKAFYDAMALRDGVPGPSGNPVADSDEDLRVLIDVLAGKVPFRVQARTRDDIMRAVRLSDEFGFKFIVSEATEAYRCLDVLAKREIPVIFGPYDSSVRSFRARSVEHSRICLTTPSRLAAAGIPFALTASELTGEGGLPQQAAFARRYGLSLGAALSAVTSTPARLLGLEKSVGTVEVGRDADLVLWSGEPFQAVTRAEVVLIDGIVVHEVGK